MKTQVDRLFEEFGRHRARVRAMHEFVEDHIQRIMREVYLDDVQRTLNLQEQMDWLLGEYRRALAEADFLVEEPEGLPAGPPPIGGNRVSRSDPDPDGRGGRPDYGDDTRAAAERAQALMTEEVRARMRGIWEAIREGQQRAGAPANGEAGP